MIVYSASCEDCHFCFVCVNSLIGGFDVQMLKPLVVSVRASRCRSERHSPLRCSASLFLKFVFEIVMAWFYFAFPCERRLRWLIDGLDHRDFFFLAEAHHCVFVLQSVYGAAGKGSVKHKWGKTRNCALLCLWVLLDFLMKLVKSRKQESTEPSAWYTCGTTPPSPFLRNVRSLLECVFCCFVSEACELPDNEEVFIFFVPFPFVVYATDFSRLHNIEHPQSTQVRLILRRQKLLLKGLPF